MGEISVTRSDREYRKFISAGTDESKTSVRVNDSTTASNKLSISAEAATFSAGAAGTTGVIGLDKAPVYNDTGTHIGDTADTSFSWVTGTVLTTEVKYQNRLTDAAQFALMSNGEYAIDYDTGKIRYQKATSGTSDTCNYTTRQTNIEVTGATDIQIGAVEIKDGDSDLRLDVATDDSAMPATPNILPAGAEYRASPTTYTDGDATVLQSDVNGYLNVATAGTSKYENASYAETEDEANDSEFVTGVMYGFDTEGSANSKLRAAQVAVDNAGLSATPNVLVGGGIHKAALDTYADNDAVPFHFDDKGRLITSVELNDYVDDSGFTVATDKLLVIGGIATSDSVDANDAGAFRMTTARNLGVDIASQSLTAVAVSATQAANLVNNPIFAAVGDGTTTAVVETAGTKKALNVNVSDGTNDMPTMDAVGRAGYSYITDGTNTMPTMDANSRPGFVTLTDGTNEVDIIGTINSVKSDTSSIAGTATNVNGGNRDAGTQTVTLADDDPAVTALEIIDDWDATHDSAVGADGAQVMFEAADFDGSALPNDVAEGDAVRPKATKYGVPMAFITSEDGSQSPFDSVNGVLKVQESADARQQSDSHEIQSATTITAAETAIGGEINCLGYNTLTFFVDYTNGDETSYDLIPKMLRVSGGDEHPYNTWSTGGTNTVTAEKFRFTATGKHYITLDVTGINIIKIYGDATAGTPDGTCQLSYTLTNN